RTLLGAFLFSDDDVDKPIKVLSGGERARVALAKLLVDPGNLVLMDEPTNHLDLESAESLAESLTTYDGTLLFVSHNRSFVRRLATRIWNVEDGKVETYPGTLDEYIDHHAGRMPSSGAPPDPDGRSQPSVRPSAERRQAPAASRETRPSASERPIGQKERRARKREEAERR